MGVFPGRRTSLLSIEAEIVDPKTARTTGGDNHQNPDYLRQFVISPALASSRCPDQ